jgi:hypothetical protein
LELAVFPLRVVSVVPSYSGEPEGATEYSDPERLYDVTQATRA